MKDGRRRLPSGNIFIRYNRVVIQIRPNKKKFEYDYECFVYVTHCLFIGHGFSDCTAL